jgi:DNA-binding response OmpR family regulator
MSAQGPQVNRLSKFTRESLERALDLEGYSVADGVEALSAIRRETSDLIILDVMMPGVDGLGVCPVVRADDMRVPILMLTARVELGARIAGLDAGADDYLAKPFELEELLARLRTLLQRAPTEPSSPDGQIPAEGFAPLTPKADAWTPTASKANVSSVASPPPRKRTPSPLPLPPSPSPSN